MSRRDYILIAETIRGLGLGDSTMQFVAERFADALRVTNPRFDRERFMAASLG